MGIQRASSRNIPAQNAPRTGRDIIRLRVWFGPGAKPDPNPIGPYLMRVTIDHSEVRRGLLFKKTFHVVTLTVAMSHEEKQIVRLRRLGGVKLLDRRPADARVDDRDQKFELRVEHLLNGRPDAFFCATPSAAKIYEDELLRMLTQLKAWIGDNAEGAPRRVVEL